MVRDTPMPRDTHCVFIRREGAAVGDAMNLADSHARRRRVPSQNRNIHAYIRSRDDPSVSGHAACLTHSMAGNIKVQNRFQGSRGLVFTRIKCDEDQCDAVARATRLLQPRIPAQGEASVRAHVYPIRRLWAMRAVLPYTTLYSLRPPNVVCDAAQVWSAPHYAQYGKPQPVDA